MHGYELFERLVRFGELTIIDHDGRRNTFGQKASDDAPCVTWRLNKPGVIKHILANPRLNLGETYMDGNWDIAQGTLHDLLSILRINLESSVTPNSGRVTPLSTMRRILKSWNSIRTSYRNVSHHYDLDEELFRACLDDDLHYSCAYFDHPQATLEQAQRAKCDLIAAKLCLQDGQHVLDIGCGWGSLAIALCQAFDIRVTGLTLSHKQMQTARARVRACGLESRIDIHQMDYREHTGRYDRVVSVGMFEHVGKRNYISNRRALLFTGGNRVVVGQSFKRVRPQVIGSIARG
jgi:cyclopropane-fatty-acyl-phospholipid synthase